MELHRGAARRVAAIALAALLLASLVSGLAAGGAVAGPTAADAPTVERTSDAATNASLAAQEVDADRTRIRIDLQEDGDATWTVELWTRLEADPDEEAFASLQADVENDSEAYTSDFRARMNGSVTAASDATGREMAIENVTVSTRTEGVPSSYGVLAYEFEWTNFAAVDGERLRAGAAIDGFLLEETTRLTMSWPDGYRVASVEPAPDDRTDSAAVWQGSETDFVGGQPRLVVTSAPAEDDSLLPLLAGGLLLAAVLALIGYLAWSGRLPRLLGGESEDDVAAADSGGVDAASAAAGAGATATDDDSSGGAAGSSEDPPSTGSPAGEADSGAAEAAEADESAEDEADDVPPELLSNEEQVLRLLEDNGGRMKQQKVVAELEWTEAKTSQVVTGMRDEEIEVFRIGRENVLALPGAADL